ncbi:magnesium/cobalt transporter CorA [Thermodesulfitimonas autotrophica]|uniref:magnesium/cobalt transporter CorA n=1 Tax=Thermodesulfitimonas autotrophica TaxID=1894989 RepID=UPI002FE22CD1
MLQLVTRAGVVTVALPEVREHLTNLLLNGEFFWLDMENPSPEEVALLQENLRFHPLTVEDCLHGQQRAKLDTYPDYLFLILYAAIPAPEEKTYRRVQFDLFIGRHYVVTFHHEPLPALNGIRQLYRETPELIRKGTGFLLYQLLHHLVEDYFPILDTIEEELEAVEHRVFLQPDQRWLQSAFRLRRQITRLRRNIAPQRDALAMLLQHIPRFLRDEDHIYLLDVYDRILRLLEVIENLHDLIVNTLDAYLSAVSNRMNEIMKLLTIITTIMMPLSVIAGIYGMNFRYMPELNWPWAYPAVLGIMALIAAGMLYYFRRKRWL